MRLKRMLSALIGAIMLLLPAVGHASGGNLVLREGSSGQDTVEIVLSTQEDLAALQFGISYDAEKLELIHVSQGTALQGGLSVINDQEPGAVYFAWATADSVSPGEEAAVLTLSFARKGEGEAQVAFSADFTIEACDENSDLVPITVAVPGIQMPEATGSEESNPTPQTTPASQPRPSHGIQLEETELSLEQGQDKDIAFEVQDPEAKIQWFSSNERVATVDENGRITAHAPGETIITAMSEDARYYAEAQVVVPGEKELAGEQIQSEMEILDDPITVTSGTAQTNGLHVWMIILLCLLGLCLVGIWWQKRKKGKHKEK